MTTSIIDYEKVDPQYLQALLQLQQLESFLQLPLLVDLQGTGSFINALDDYRNVIALHIESIGKR
jgi:hypothetical protein